jgi:hypothetical protein
MKLAAAPVVEHGGVADREIESLLGLHDPKATLAVDHHVEPVADLSRATGVAASTLNDRIKCFARQGVIAGHHARLSLEALGLDLLAFGPREATRDEDGDPWVLRSSRSLGAQRSPRLCWPGRRWRPTGLHQGAGGCPELDGLLCRRKRGLWMGHRFDRRGVRVRAETATLGLAHKLDVGSPVVAKY